MLSITLKGQKEEKLHVKSNEGRLAKKELWMPKYDIMQYNSRKSRAYLAGQQIH